MTRVNSYNLNTFTTTPLTHHGCHGFANKHILVKDDLQNSPEVNRILVFESNKITLLNHDKTDIILNI